MALNQWPLDAASVIQSVYDLDQNALRVNTQATVTAGALEVAIDATTDSIKIGDGTDFLSINPDGSINVVAALSESTDSILIYGWDGSSNQKVKVDTNGELQIDVLSSALPSGASTSALQITGNTSLSSIDSKIPSGLTVTSTRLLVDGSGATQPVSGTITANQGTSPWIISGTVTANAGMNLNTSALALAATQTDRTQKTQITDGTRDGTIKAASTAALAADTSLVVALSPNSPLPTGSNTIGALSANQSVNVNQWGGTDTTLGQKAMTASVPVVIASDQSAVTVAQATAANLNAQVVGNVASAATDSGNPVKVGAKYNSTLTAVTNGQRVDAQANAFGELAVRPRNKFLNITGNATTTVKSGAGVLGTVVVNNGANATTITIYDNTTATGTKIATIAVLGINTNVMSSIRYDLEFSTGLTIVTAGSAANDITVTYQ